VDARAATQPIPLAIRQRLDLQAGQILEFDEEAPYILAVPVFDEEAMRSVVGCTRGRLKKTSGEWLDETRGRPILSRPRRAQALIG
jgi:bifunctional DNA-binding transcriptional regulator/antitoxin component of YhaV-PrlF toxin-antitoxin module